MVDLWDIRNQELEFKFARYKSEFSLNEKTSNSINCVIFEKDLKQDNDLKKISDEGFEIPEKGGLLIPIGHVRSNLNEDTVLQAIICEVVIGRAKKLKPINISDQLLMSEEFKGFYDTILIDDTSKNLHPNTQDIIIFHKE